VSNPIHGAGRSGSTVRHSKEDALTEREFEKLLEGASRLRRSDYYYKADPEFVISMLGRLGLRRGELVHLRESWIDWRNKMIKIPTHDGCDFGKGGDICGYCEQLAKQRAEYAGNDLSLEQAREWVWVPKTEAAAREIYFGFDPRVEMYIERYFDSSEYDRVEVSGSAISRRVKKCAELGGLDPESIHPHCLRATAATFHASRGLETLSLMQMFGWCQPQTAEVYISRNGTNTKKQLDAIHS
jgi:integrase